MPQTPAPGPTIDVDGNADNVTREEVPALLDALGPTLRTLLGKRGAETVAAEIERELAL